LGPCDASSPDFEGSKQGRSAFGQRSCGVGLEAGRSRWIPALSLSTAGPDDPDGRAGTASKGQAGREEALGAARTGSITAFNASVDT
jgi:hypothetical protein